MNSKQLNVLKKNNESSREFTRSCISYAFIILLNKENVELKDLSVTKLCSVAGVSRAAFYRNYTSVEDVLDDKIKEAAVKLNACIETDIYNNWLNIFKFAEQNHLLFETIIKAGCEHKILEIFLSYVPIEEENRSIQTLWITLIYTFIIKWLKEKTPKKAEDMAKVAYKYTKSIPIVSA